MSREVRYFGPHREPAMLVEDFDELRTGMVVWLSPCQWCKRSVRLMLLNQRRENPMQPDGSLFGECQVFDTTHCHGAADVVVVSRWAIGDRRMFAVIDEPPAKAESRTRRRKLVTS